MRKDGVFCWREVMIIFLKAQTFAREGDIATGRRSDTVTQPVWEDSKRAGITGEKKAFGRGSQLPLVAVAQPRPTKRD